MEAMCYYTDERNVQILLFLLKAHGIRKVVASPGATNVTVVASMQQDSFFEIYSCVDERSAAYMACGLALESGEPVVLSCTGATSSRNYMPGLTEAFYRKLPIIAVTSSMETARVGHLYAQATDRTSPPPDVVEFSYTLPIVKDEEDEWDCVIKVNKAILDCKKGMPVHLNLETTYSRNFSVKELPTCRVIHRFSFVDDLPVLPHGRIAVFMGSHKFCSEEEKNLLDEFCASYDAVVLCDHTSGYKGKYRVLSALIAGQVQNKYELCDVDLLIHIGEISGDYYTLGISPKEVWRVSKEGKVQDTFRKLTTVFEMPEKFFLKSYISKAAGHSTRSFLAICKNAEKKVRSLIPELPFSNIWIASQLSRSLPENSNLHLGILNSLRAWNFFDVPKSVNVNCNVGGFGIDGVMSTAIGASLVNPEQLYFIIVGDLSFFYDINVLGNRHCGNNIRILLINNGKGTEFRNYRNIGDVLHEKTDPYIAAAGHNGDKSSTLVQSFVSNLGFDYLSAKDKNEFLEVYAQFVSPQITKKPILFEVFTDSEDESEALRIMLNLDVDKKLSVKKKINGIAENVLGKNLSEKLKRAVK